MSFIRAGDESALHDVCDNLYRNEKVNRQTNKESDSPGAVSALSL